MILWGRWGGIFTGFRIWVTILLWNALSDCQGVQVLSVLSLASWIGDGDFPKGFVLMCLEWAEEDGTFGWADHVHAFSCVVDVQHSMCEFLFK